MKIEFLPPNTENPFGKLKASIDFGDTLNLHGPFRFEIVNTIDNKLKWQSADMMDGHWATYVEPCNCIATIKNSKGQILESYTWDTNQHGDQSHKIFLEWCQKNKGSKGISVGTHDGSTGEWVVPIKNGLIEGYLVEASQKQFSDLVENYKEDKNVKTIMSLVTKDGADIEFFESEDGFTNSTSKEHVLRFNNQVTSFNRSSISLNELIIQCGLEKDLKWLHLDVEGIDDELIMSIDDKRVNLPEIIIYESLNLSHERKDKVIKWLESKNYSCEESGWNTIATLNKLDLSLLIQTCDSYEKFWPGMFYTLDFYWDYDFVPVYFANEEKNLSDIVFELRDKIYKPDKRINQILTGKTDKMGFSNRFIDAVKKVPSKYVLYLQEDMWLRRSLDKEILRDLVKFMEDNNADSLKLHAKLFYYHSYNLKPTGQKIKNQPIYKYDSDEYILSHNATIWRKDYILKHQIEGEDPWTNELKGSQRMASENQNNYMYNIHWHCQPGVADNGEESQEHVVYAHIVDEMKYIELKYQIE